MKILLLLLAIPIASFAQTIPPKGATMAIIQTPDSAATALKKLATILVSQGYTVEKLDAQFLTLTLTPKAIKHNFNPLFSIRAIASGGAKSSVRLSGDYKAGSGAVLISAPAEYSGSETGTNKTCFKELQKAALAYPNAQVSYSK